MLNGAFVRVLGDGFENDFLLPAANWGALLKDGILKLIGKGAALGHSLATEPADLTVVFESGTGDYLCLGVGAGSKTSFKADKTYKAVKNAAPASCPAYVPY